MKKLLALTFLVAFATLGMAQVSETRNIGAFNGVKAAEGIDVYLKKGDKESARVEVTGTKLEDVLTEISGSYLKIHLRDGNYRGNVNAKVYVTYVNIEKLSASSAASVFTEGILKTNDLDISCSSAANLELNLDAQRVEVSASSAGEVELQGKVKSLIAEASSAGEVDAYDLEAGEVEVEVSSAGSAKVNALNSLTANASSGGSIRYRGNPGKSMTNSSSGGSVKKSN